MNLSLVTSSEQKRARDIRPVDFCKTSIRRFESAPRLHDSSTQQSAISRDEEGHWDDTSGPRVSRDSSLPSRSRTVSVDITQHVASLVYFGNRIWPWWENPRGSG